MNFFNLEKNIRKMIMGGTVSARFQPHASRAQLGPAAQPAKPAHTEDATVGKI
jgi:hypothetical protein